MNHIGKSLFTLVLESLEFRDFQYPKFEHAPKLPPVIKLLKVHIRTGSDRSQNRYLFAVIFSVSEGSIFRNIEQRFTFDKPGKKVAVPVCTLVSILGQNSETVNALNRSYETLRTTKLLFVS